MRRAGLPAGIGQAKIKKVAGGQSEKQISESDPGHQAAAGAAHDHASTPAENDHAFADLVWKYFAAEITQALIEVQELLEREQNMTGKAGK